MATTTATIEEVLDRAGDAGGQNPYEFTGAPKDPEQCARYSAYEGYLDNVRQSPLVFAGSTVEDLVGGAESHADSEWPHYLNG